MNRSRIIQCDKCSAKTPVGFYGSDESIRRQARQELAWGFIDGQDLCPKCRISKLEILAQETSDGLLEFNRLDGLPWEVLMEPLDRLLGALRTK